MLVGDDKVEVTDLASSAMARVANARDTALRQSNKFLLGGMGSSALYAIKLAGLRLDLVVADTPIFETPYGLFVFGIVGSVCFLLAQLRFLDGKALDLKLKRMSPDANRSCLAYDTFPSVHNWLAPSELEFGGNRAGLITKLAFVILGLTTLLVYMLPLFASAHFLLNWPNMAGENYTPFQWWSVLVLFISALATYIFAQAVYFQRER